MQKDLFGHSSITMTDRYMHSDQADIHDAVQKLKPSRSRCGHATPTTPFPSNVMSGYRIHTAEGKIGVTFSL